MPKRILYAEDGASLRTTMAGILESFGYEVVAVDSGDAAIETAKGQAFDLVLTDRQMEDDGAGFRVAEEIRKMHPAVPILMMSGCLKIEEPIIVKRLHACGGNDFLSKGASLDAIEVFIRKNLEGSQRSL